MRGFNRRPSCPALLCVFDRPMQTRSACFRQAERGYRLHVRGAQAHRDVNAAANIGDLRISVFLPSDLLNRQCWQT